MLVASFFLCVWILSRKRERCGSNFFSSSIVVDQQGKRQKGQGDLPAAQSRLSLVSKCTDCISGSIVGTLSKGTLARSSSTAASRISSHVPREEEPCGAAPGSFAGSSGCAKRESDRDRCAVVKGDFGDIVLPANRPKPVDWEKWNMRQESSADNLGVPKAFHPREADHPRNDRMLEDIKRKFAWEIDCTLRTMHCFKEKSNNSDRLRAIGMKIIKGMNRKYDTIRNPKGVIKKLIVEWKEWSSKFDKAMHISEAWLHSNPSISYDPHRVYDGKPFVLEPTFYQGSKSHRPAKVPETLKAGGGLPVRYSVVKLVHEDLTVLDTVSGITMDSQDVLLVPRVKALQARLTHNKATSTESRRATIYDAFRKLEMEEKQDKVRDAGVKRIAGKDGVNSRYINLGKVAVKKRGGIVHSWKTFEKESVEKEAFDRWYHQVETVMYEHMPGHMRRFLEELEKAKAAKGMGSPGISKVWHSMAVGRNVFANVHQDDDFFWTVVTIATSTTPILSKQDAIICFFCFPTLGIAIALRDGDILLFNPRLPHCISTRVDGTKEAYCCGMYMKTRVVSGNSNREEVSAEELVLSGEMLRLMKMRGLKN